MFQMVLTTPTLYFGVFLIPFTALIVDIAYKYGKSTLYPSETDIARRKGRKCNKKSNSPILRQNSTESAREIINEKLP